jgi:cytoskeletal protein CcmA (bactofilin family)
MMHRIVLLLAGLALAGAAAAQTLPGVTLRLGGDVDVAQPLEGALHALAGNLSIDARVSGDVSAAAGEVRLAPNASIDGDVALAAGKVKLDGPIQGDVRVAAGHVQIDAPVAGNVSIAAGSLELGPAARIQGRLSFRGGELRRDPAAQVIGGIMHSPARHWSEPEPIGWRFHQGWIWTLGLMALAALIAAALPDASRRMAHELGVRPWITPLLGLVALASIPIAAVLLMLTIIGIPIALLALVGYAGLLLVAYAWVAVVVGAMLLDVVHPQTAARTAWRVAAAVLAMLALAILVRVPVVGGLVKLAALAVGLGMIFAAAFRHAPPASPQPLATPGTTGEQA